MLLHISHQSRQYQYLHRLAYRSIFGDILNNIPLSHILTYAKVWVKLPENNHHSSTVLNPLYCPIKKQEKISKETIYLIIWGNNFQFLNEVPIPYYLKVLL